MDQNTKQNKPKMSNTEWGLLIGALAMIDAIQLLLDLVVIGFAVNEFIDIFIGMALPFYLHIRGQDMAKPSRWGGLIIGLFVEMIGDGTLPFWWADGVYFFLLARREKKGALLSAIPGGSIISGAKNTAGKVFSSNSSQNKNFSTTRNQMKATSNLSRNSNLREIPRQKSEPTNVQSQIEKLSDPHGKISEDRARKYKEGTKDPTQAYRDEMNKFYGRETPKENKPNMEDVLKKDEEKRKVERDKKWEEGTKYRREFKSGEGLTDRNDDQMDKAA